MGGFFSQDNPPPLEQAEGGTPPGNVVVQEPTGVDGATSSFFGRGPSPQIQAFEEEAKQAAEAAAASAEEAEDAATAAAGSAQNAVNTASGIETSVAVAVASKNEAQASAALAEQAVTTTQNSAAAAATSAGQAATSANNAQNSASGAASSSTQAASSAQNAATSAGAAASSANNIQTAANTATTKAVEAATSATQAASSATAAAGSATSAASSVTASSTNASNAAASATTASTAATTATTESEEAATSATNAAGSATAAAGSATGAAGSAATATTKAAEASTSATGAAGSATTATTKASEAAASATSAAGSATTATTKAAEASTSAANAASSVTASSTNANNAATSATNAANSATAAAGSATAAAGSASSASSSASSASGSASSAASAQTAAESARDATLAAFDSFDDRYLGVKTSNPTVDNDGNALVAGALYFNSTAGEMRVYTGTAWAAAYVSGAGVLLISNNLSDVANAASARTNLGLGNVENKSSATIRGEISSSNVTTALGYTPANRAGDTFTGPITVNSGANQVILGSDGAIELTRGAGGAYFDFKNSTAEDFDVRLQASGNQLNISAAGGLTLNGAGVLTGITSGQVTTALGYTPPQPNGTGASGTWGINVTGNAGTVTNGVYTTGNQTIGGTKTFSSTALLADGGFMFASDGAQDTGISWASDGVMNVRCNAVTVGQFNSTGFTGNAATVSSVTSGQVTTALGYTPYNATNPAGYITASSLSAYLPLTGGALNVAGVASTHIFAYNESGGEFQLIDSTGAGPILLDNAGGLARFLKVGSGNMAIGTTSTGSLRFQTVDTERMRLDASGNMAIGTTSTGGGRLTVNGGNGVLVNGSGAAGYNVTQFVNDNAITLSVGVSGSTAGGWTTNLAHLGTVSNSPLAFGTNSAERMRISASGNVGINTTTPSTNLEVNGGLIAGSENRQTHPGVGPVGFKAQWNFTGGDGETDLYNLYSVGTTSFRFYQSTGNNTAQLLYNMRPSSHEFYTGGVERMRVDSSGSVGIGTSGPTVKLDVVGNVLAREDNAGGANPVLIRNSNTGNNTGKSSSALFQGTDTVGTVKNIGSIGFFPDDANYISSNLRFSVRSGDATPTERMRLDASGNLGVGTSNVLSRLDINDQSRVRWYLGTAGLVNIEYTNAAANAYVTHRMQASEHQFYTGGSERGRFNTSGEFLTGTTAGGRAVCMHASDMWLRLSNPSRQWLIGPSAGTTFRIWDETGGASRLEIDASGNTTTTGLLIGRNSASTDVNSANDTGSISVRGTTTTVASMSFHRAGAYALNMGLGTDNVFRIGGWSASSNAFQMDGSGNLTMLGNVTAYSDIRMKKDVETIDNALDLVSKMRGVKYVRKDTGEAGVGVIAQEMLEVVPEVVQQGIGDDDTLSVAYGNLVGVLIEAIKELKAEIEQLKGSKT